MDSTFWNYSYFIISILHLACIFHMFRNGRNREWLYLLILLPFFGSVVYIIQEVLPGFSSNSVAGQRSPGLFSGGRIKDLERKLRIANTDANRLALASELAAAGKYERAIELTKTCLTGIYANNLGMMQDIARYSFYAGKFEDSRSWFDRIAAQKDVRLEKPEDELMYAKALQETGETDRAEEAFKRIIRVHHSVEARYCYGMLLKETGRTDEARSQFKAIPEEQDLHPRHVQRVNRRWVGAARRQLFGMK